MIPLSPETISNFQDALRAAYCERPCEVLPNALWKTQRMLGQGGFSTGFSIDRERGTVESVQACDRERLLVLWRRNGRPPELEAQRIEHLQLALLHERYASGFPVHFSPQATRSFRLIHRGRAGEVRLPQGYLFRQVEAAGEVEAVAELINRCYEGNPATVEAVHRWVGHPVYAPDLWVWVMDLESGAPAGLGIAELDTSLPEASLEWIQVHPGHRRKGIGVALVGELLRRIQGRACWTTAAGRLDSPMNPEGLYRRCGFEGNDVWWVLRRNADA